MQEGSRTPRVIHRASAYRSPPILLAACAAVLAHPGGLELPGASLPPGRLGQQSGHRSAAGLEARGAPRLSLLLYEKGNRQCFGWALGSCTELIRYRTDRLTFSAKWIRPARLDRISFC